MTRRAHDLAAAAWLIAAQLALGAFDWLEPLRADGAACLTSCGCTPCATRSSMLNSRQEAIAFACRRNRRLAALFGLTASRSWAKDRAISRKPARAAASASVQSITSRCA